MAMATRQKRASEIQCRSCTTMRCMTAIWPAGPPKTQQRNAQPDARCFRETDTVRRQGVVRRDTESRFGARAAVGMFVVTEGEAAAIRAAFDQGGEICCRGRAAPAVDMHERRTNHVRPIPIIPSRRKDYAF